MAITIKTNHQPRDIIRGYDLSEGERNQFDYYDDEQIEWQSFFYYKGELYDLGDFVRIVSPDSKSNGFEHVDFEGNFTGWQGYMSDSYFSGIVIRYTDDCEQVIVGTYFS